MPKITRPRVDRLQPQESPYFVWDEGKGHVKGFGVAVYPTGIKSYIFQYRNAYGETRRITLGKHGTDITVTEARGKAEEYSNDVYNDKDPAAEKKRKRSAPTVNDLLDEYLESPKFASKSEVTRKTDRGRIDRHLRPLLGARVIETLTTDDIRRARDAIRDGKTAVDVKTGKRGRAIVKGGEGAARMAIRVMRAIFSWGVDQRLIAGNPAKGIKLGKDGNRTAVLETTDDYTRLFRTLDRLEQEHRLRAPVADCIRVLALTGARRNEIAGLRWRWVNLKRGVIALPAGAHKTGKDTGEKEISLPALAQEIISRQAGGGPDELVFRPARGEGPISLSKPWQMIRKEAGLPPDMGLHGLRHSLATLMAYQGAQAPEIMAALGHRQLSTAGRYIQSVNDARRAVVEKHTAGIAAAITGKAASDNVEPLKKAKV